MHAALPLSPHLQQVLYAEDDPTHRVLMQALFRMRPHLELLLARDGAQATALAHDSQPALLLVDIRLPDCLGSELVPLLRLRFGWHDVPAVAVTAETSYELNASFVEVWRKPLDLVMVLQRLDELLPAAARPAPTVVSSGQTVTRRLA